MMPLLAPLAAAGLTAGLLWWLVGNTSAVLAPFECVAVALAAWGVLLVVLVRIDPEIAAYVRRAVPRRHRPRHGLGAS